MPIGRPNSRMRHDQRDLVLGVRGRSPRSSHGAWTCRCPASHRFRATAGAVIRGAMNLFPGRLLLTEAARAALPTTFRCSSRPGTEVEAVPIYLALEGWGYSEPDPVQVPRSPELSDLSDWVAAFAVHHPERIDGLSTAGIHNEESYREFESSLDRELRTLLGCFRLARSARAQRTIRSRSYKRHRRGCQIARSRNCR